MTNSLSNATTKPFSMSNKNGGNDGSAKNPFSMSNKTGENEISNNPDKSKDAKNIFLDSEGSSASGNVGKQTRTITGESSKTTADEPNKTVERINETERINGVAIGLEYGAYSLNGQVNRVLSFPSLKEPDKTDWFEEDGVEVDLSNPVFDVREYDLHYGVKARSSDDFLEFLNGLEGYVPFVFWGLSEPIMLRIVRHRYKYLSCDRNMTLFTLTVVENAPLEGYIYKQPSDEVPRDKDIFAWDGRNFSEYGISTLAGGLGLSFIPNRKRGFSSTSKYSPGEDYSACRGGKESQELTMRLLLRATSESDYRRKRNAFLYDLSRPGEHLLKDTSTNYVYQSCYLGGESRSVCISEAGIWQLMALKLLLIRGGK